MGLKDWLAKNVSGPSGYGEVMAREAVKNGLAFGRTLYLSHWTRDTASVQFVCENEQHMRSEGFTPYCTDPLNRPPMQDSSELSRHTRIAGVAFATQCSITAASNFMQRPNASAFNRSMGASSKQELLKSNIGITADDIMQYLRIATPESGVTTVLNMTKPGEGDVLSLFLAEASKKGRGAVSFQRSGVVGFLIGVQLLD